MLTPTHYDDIFWVNKNLQKSNKFLGEYYLQGFKKDSPKLENIPVKSLSDYEKIYQYEDTIISDYEKIYQCKDPLNGKFKITLSSIEYDNLMKHAFNEIVKDI